MRIYGRKVYESHGDISRISPFYFVWETPYVVRASAIYVKSGQTSGWIVAWEQSERGQTERESITELQTNVPTKFRQGHGNYITLSRNLRC